MPLTPLWRTGSARVQLSLFTARQWTGYCKQIFKIAHWKQENYRDALAMGIWVGCGVGRPTARRAAVKPVNSPRASELCVVSQAHVCPLSVHLFGGHRRTRGRRRFHWPLLGGCRTTDDRTTNWSATGRTVGNAYDTLATQRCSAGVCSASVRWRAQSVVNARSANRWHKSSAGIHSVYCMQRLVLNQCP